MSNIDHRSAWQPDDPGVAYRGAHASPDFLTQLTDAARENPVPAALIGIGVLWMFLGGNAGSVVGGGGRWLGRGMRYGGEAAYDAARSAGSLVASGAGYAAETLSDVAAGTADVTRRLGGAIGETVSGAAAQASDLASGAYDAVGSAAGRARESLAGMAPDVSRGPTDLGQQAQASGREWGSAVQHSGREWAHAADATAREWGNTLHQNLSDLFERQPLLLGAVGIGIGAAIAASLPRTRVEQRYLGEASGALMEQAKEFVSGATDAAKVMAQRAVEEAKAQGLTPQAAGEALREVAGKVGGLAQSASDSARQNLQGAAGASGSGPRAG